MKKILLLLPFLTNLSSDALSASLSELTEDLQIGVLDFLDPDSLREVRKSGNQSISKKLLGPGGYLREHMFDITLNDDSSKTLRDYLQGERAPITEVKNLVTLLKESPNTFIRLMLKSTPHTETIDSDLRTFHQDTFKVDNLISSVPTYETAQQKLAGVLIELMTWAQVRDQVWAQVRDQVWAQVWAQVGAQVGDQVWAQVWDQVRAQVRDQVWAQVRTQVWAQVRAQVNEELRHCQFASAFEDGNLNQVLKPAIDYAFTVYQLGTLAMRHSEAFKSIHTNFAQFISHPDLSQFISQRISEEQATAILNGLNIPDAPEGNYLIDTQLKLIKRHLPIAE